VALFAQINNSFGDADENRRMRVRHGRLTVDEEMGNEGHISRPGLESGDAAFMYASRRK